MLYGFLSIWNPIKTTLFQFSNSTLSACTSLPNFIKFCIVMRLRSSTNQVPADLLMPHWFHSLSNSLRYEPIFQVWIKSIKISLSCLSETKTKALAIFRAGWPTYNTTWISFIINLIWDIGHMFLYPELTLTLFEKFYKFMLFMWLFVWVDTWSHLYTYSSIASMKPLSHLGQV